VERCIHAPDGLRFDIVFARSDNRYNRVEIRHAREVLGYAPQDRVEDRLDRRTSAFFRENDDAA
jgi:hypothetical protein